MRRALAALGLVPALACSACIPEGLAFKVDKRVEVMSPREDATVSLPFTVRWSVRDFEVVEPGTPPREGAGYFAVFLDETPMAPGKSLDDLREADPDCDTGCTEPSYFVQRGIYPTSQTELVVKAMPLGEDGETHRATIVLLDSRGTRLGESAWHVDFRLPQQEENS